MLRLTNRARPWYRRWQPGIIGGGGFGAPSGWPLAWWSSPGQGLAGVVLTANTMFLCAISIPAQVRYSKIAVVFATADAVNLSDVGLYDSAGKLVANAGAQTIAGTGSHTFTTLQGVNTIGPGTYFFAGTSNASTLSITRFNTSASLYFNAAFGTSVGGALPSSITPPALALTVGGALFTLG